MESNLLSGAEGSLSPSLYAKADSGFCFRFPFPDEDKQLLGADLNDFDRGVPFNLDSAIVEPPEKCGVKDGIFQMEIVQQRLVHRKSDNLLCLALVLRTRPLGEYFRVEDDIDVKNILSQIIKHHILQNNDPLQRSFYRNIAARILKGYRLNVSQVLERKPKNQPREILSDNSSVKRKI
ncbi:MAG: hypothetical protein KF746_27355 [Chitinophagaceae bacterium]|nr:hypothetical protein [Chitinophagaceae bacterium]